MNVKISVVVPVYKVEKYLKKCVDSILAQTLNEIEVILVDDGSPDGCPEMIDDYAKADPRVKAIHQKNAGYGAAVNRGIKSATGEYVGIIESDDWVEPEMFEVLYKNALETQADVVKGMFWKTNTSLPEGEQDELFSNPAGVDLRLAPDDTFTITQWPTLLAFHASLWSAIYHREFLLNLADGKALFEETAGAAYQDFPFIMKVLCGAKKIKVVKQPFVHWRNDPDQLHSTSATDKKALAMVRSCATGIDIVKSSGYFEELKEALYIHVLWTNVGFFYEIKPEYKKTYWIALRELLYPVKLDKTFRYQYFRKIDKIFFEIITNRSWLVVRCGLAAMTLRRKLKHRG